MAAPFLRRRTPFLSFNLRLQQVSYRFFSVASSDPRAGGHISSSDSESPLKSSLYNLFRVLPTDSASSTAVSSSAFPPSDTIRTPDGERSGDADKDERLQDVDSVVSLAKEILHSTRYENLEPLTGEDENTVIEKLLRFHPNRDKKIGCGIQAIVVDWHPHFRSRCFFVLRTDGSSIDFSYRKCTKEYIKYKLPHSSRRFRASILRNKEVKIPVLKSSVNVEV